jgi:hypothetical protein
MGTFAASVHLDRRATRVATLEQALSRLDDELTATWTDRWLSLHLDDVAFSVEAFPLGRRLSKATGAKVVVFALHDSDRALAEVYVAGRSVASLEGHDGALTWRRAAWVRAGADADVLDDLDASDADECIEVLADALGIPGETVLVDEGEAKVHERSRARSAKSKPRVGKGAAALATVQKEWEALEAEARAAGVAVPTWKHQLRLNAVFADQAPTTIRNQIALIRGSLRRLAPKRR